MNLLDSGNGAWRSEVSVAGTALFVDIVIGVNRFLEPHHAAGHSIARWKSPR